MTKQAQHLEEANRTSLKSVTSIKTAVRQAHGLSGVEGPFDGLTVLSKVEGLKINTNSKQMKINCGAERHHYSMFDVGCSMFDVHL